MRLEFVNKPNHSIEKIMVGEISFGSTPQTTIL